MRGNFGGPPAPGERDWWRDVSRVLKMETFTPSERAHLWRVYATLLSGVAMTGGGVIAGNWLMSGQWMSPQSLTLLGGLAAMVLGFVVQYESAVQISGATNAKHEQQVARRSLIAFEAGSFSMGLSLAAFVIFAAIISSQILITAVVSAMVVFSSLTLSALFAPRRSYFWLAGLLGPVVMFMLVGSFASIFFRTPLLMNAMTYGGLFLGAGYTLIDTQLMLERTSLGIRAPSADAWRLYNNLVRIFIYLLRILLERDEGSNNRRKRRTSR